MRRRALEILACPACAGALELEHAACAGEEILEGQLRCSQCSEAYPIVRGVPRFALGALAGDAQRTVDRFGAQWEEYDFLSAEYERQFLAWVAPNSPATFRDRIVLDAGCGKGRHSVLVSRFGAREVIALDLGSGVEAAYRNTRDLSNVHVVQADIFRLPVAPGSLDIAFSIGVLHHTPEPKGAFLALVRSLRPGGRLIIWVYGRENNEWILRYVDPIRGAVTSRLPHRWLYHLAKIPALLLYVASRGIYRPLSRPPLDPIGRRLFYHAYIRSLVALPFRDVHLIVHDHLGPPIASYIPGEEFASWFRAAGLAEVTIGWHNQNSWRGSAVKPATTVQVANDLDPTPPGPSGSPSA